MKVSYNSDPIIFTILSAFRSLLRRSVVFDINAKDNQTYMYCPDYNLTIDNDNEITINNNIKDTSDKDIKINNNKDVKITNSKDIKTTNNSDIKMTHQMNLLKKNFDVPEEYRKKHKYILAGEEVEIGYRYNQIGYRGKNVLGTEKFIAIGCSQTFGTSLEEEFTWPAQLEKILGSRVVNLGTPGDSARGSILKAMAYIKQFEKPEAIFACFPIARSEKFSVPGKTVNKKTNLPGPFSSMHLKDGFRLISKAPYDYEEITPLEDYILDTFSFINMFDSYCKEAGIKLIWTGWESQFASNRVKDVLNEHTSGFFFDNSMNDFNFVKENPECHTEYLEHPLFDYAADLTVDSDGRKNGHKGIHWNIHMAEKCYLEYLKYKPIDYSINK